MFRFGGVWRHPSSHVVLFHTAELLQSHGFENGWAIISMVGLGFRVLFSIVGCMVLRFCL